MNTFKLEVPCWIGFLVSADRINNTAILVINSLFQRLAAAKRYYVYELRLKIRDVRLDNRVINISNGIIYVMHIVKKPEFGSSIFLKACIPVQMVFCDV